MSIDELMAILAAAREELGGNAQVVRYEDGNDDKSSVVRIEDAMVQNAVVQEIGNGMAGWTLDESKPGTPVKCLLLE